MDDLCLINPPIGSDCKLYVPLQLFLLQSWLQSKDVTSGILDLALISKTNTHDCSHDPFEKYVPFFKPIKNYRYVGIGTTCDTIAFAISLAKWIKRIYPDKIIIFGGPHATACWHELLDHYSTYIDYVVVGEGEHSLDQLIEHLKEVGNAEMPHGIAYEKDGDIKFSGQRNLIADLDSLPQINWNNHDMDRYHSAGAALNLEVGRGCPFSCCYCSTSVMWRRKYRVKSCERVIHEIDSVVQATKYRHISFMHDCFTADRRYVSSLCDLLSSSRSHITWSAYSRADSCDDTLYAKMRSAGCVTLFIGIESGSQRLQNVIGKKIDLNASRRKLRAAAYYIPNTVTSFIFGFPSEEADDIHKTILYASRLSVDGISKFQAFKLSPLPGTDIFRNHQKNLYFQEKHLPNFVSPEALLHCRNDILKYKTIYAAFYSVANDNNIDDDTFFFLQEYLPMLVKAFPFTFIYYSDVKKCSLYDLIVTAIESIASEEKRDLFDRNIDYSNRCSHVYHLIKEHLICITELETERDILTYDFSAYEFGREHYECDKKLTIGKKAYRWILRAQGKTLLSMITIGSGKIAVNMTKTTINEGVHSG